MSHGVCVQPNQRPHRVYWSKVSIPFSTIYPRSSRPLVVGITMGKRRAKLHVTVDFVGGLLPWLFPPNKLGEHSWNKKPTVYELRPKKTSENHYSRLNNGNSTGESPG